jgi:hypothetical protein
MHIDQGKAIINRNNEEEKSPLNLKCKAQFPSIPTH